MRELGIPEGNWQTKFFGSYHHYSIFPNGTEVRGWGDNGLYKEPNGTFVRGRRIHLDQEDERLQPRQRDLCIMGQDLDFPLDEDDDEDAFWVPEIPASEALKNKVCPEA